MESSFRSIAFAFALLLPGLVVAQGVAGQPSTVSAATVTREVEPVHSQATTSTGTLVAQDVRRPERVVPATTGTTTVVQGARSVVASSAPPANPSPGALDCPTSCKGNMTTVYRKDDAGQCRAWFRFACTPYDCDESAGMCREYCGSDQDCAQGGKCNTLTGLCAAMSTSCRDAFNVVQANGQSQSCAPYKCIAGTCSDSCSLGGDCAPGYSCNVAAGACVPSGK